MIKKKQRQNTFNNLFGRCLVGILKLVFHYSLQKVQTTFFCIIIFNVSIGLRLRGNIYSQKSIKIFCKVRKLIRTLVCFSIRKELTNIQ